MVIQQEKNLALPGKHGRPIVTDLYYSDEKKKKPVLIFCHGYKGFKDWGIWDLMAKSFVRNGFFFIKFNFAFNGGNLEKPIDFPDLDAFSKNTFIKELDDLEVVLNYISDPDFKYSQYADTHNISLMGHSRGGGTVILKAAEDKRVKKLISLAAVSDFESRFPQGEELDAWKKNGIGYVENTRTKQQMPHLYAFYENFKENEDRLTISKAAKSLKIPFLIIHGTEDATVNFSNAKDLQRWAPHSELFRLEGSNHVFEGTHPWNSNELPEAFQKIVTKVSKFLQEN